MRENTTNKRQVVIANEVEITREMSKQEFFFNFRVHMTYYTDAIIMYFLISNLNDTVRYVKAKII